MATQQQIQDAILNTVEGSFDFDYVDILESVIDRVDDYNNEEDIAEAIDDAFIYYNDHWIIAKHFYNSPLDVDKDELIEQFTDDVYSVCNKLAEAKEEQ